MAGAILSFSVTVFVVASLYGEESTALAGARSRAAALAEEGVEAARSIRDGNYFALSDGTYGLILSGGQWTFGGAQDITDNFTRKITITSPDSMTKRVVVAVTWPQNLQRLGQITMTSLLTNWRSPTGPPPRRGGMLVYGSGGTTTDAVRYRVLDSAGSWGAAALAADVDVGSTNRVLYVAQVYAAPTTTEKILLSRHYDGRDQYVYGQVFNGSGWGNVTLLSSWRAGSLLDANNFTGAYLSDGRFLALYSDNSNLPKMRLWNSGTGQWSGEVSLPNLGATPRFMAAQTRPGSNEVMLAILDSASDTSTYYFDGAAWAGPTQHATAAASNAQRLVDFAWNPTAVNLGALVYTDSNKNKDRYYVAKLWTANGGGGTWSGAVQTLGNSNNFGSLAVDGRPNANEFATCGKDTANPPKIVCYTIVATLAGSVYNPTLTVPANNTLAPTTDAGVQASFDVGFGLTVGAKAVGVYADTTPAAKLKRFIGSSQSWDAAATSLPPMGAAVETARVVSDPSNNDAMIVIADTSQNLATVEWNGDSDASYATPPGRAFSAHPGQGVLDEAYWYDFAWDGPAS